MDMKVNQAKYKTWQEASNAAISLGITSQTEYIKKYKEDPFLPSNPHQVYSNVWTENGGYYSFLGKKVPNFYETWQEASNATIILNITTMNEYQKRYKEDPLLPGAPVKFYKNVWKKNGGSYGFLGKENKLTIHNIPGEYKRWGTYAESFLEKQRAQNTKSQAIGKFVHKFIITGNHSNEPEKFLFKNLNVEGYEKFINKWCPKSRKSVYSKAIVDFLDYILEIYCSEENHLGILETLDGFKNPLKAIKINSSKNTLSESDKPPLPYSEIVRVREWLIPKQANNFKDLPHLYDGDNPIFSADWQTVNESIIDKSDTNCVWRIKRVSEKNVYQIWSPARAIANYVLLQVPARGVQVVLLDSGEADIEVPVLTPLNEIKWIKNNNKLISVLSKNKSETTGFIKKYPEKKVGMHFTTNKTSMSEGGYSFPWIPENLIPWVIKLREWQTKYNPISQRTNWTDIRLRSKLNNNILKQRGDQCFLFRIYGSGQPLSQASAFFGYLQSILYHAQGSFLLAEKDTSENHIYRKYQSKYTTHSLRVSLITALIMDFGLPAAVVSKLVGHARIIMTLYYVKVGHYDIREHINSGHKKAMSKASDHLQQQIYDQGIESAKPFLTSINNNLLGEINSDFPLASLLFTDIGICSMGGGRCNEGGITIKGSIRAPVNPGVISGTRNCPQCCFFITGPAFLGGLTAKANAIALEVKYSSDSMEHLNNNIKKIEDNSFDDPDNLEISAKLRKAEAEYEQKVTRFDSLAIELNHYHKVISDSLTLLKKITQDKAENKQLIIYGGMEQFQLVCDEASEIHQLQSICEDAEIFTSCHQEGIRAAARRSQVIDTLCRKNCIEPQMYYLSEEQQLTTGNQLMSLLIDYCGSWKKIDQLFEGNLRLDDLQDKGNLISIKEEIQQLLNNDRPQLDYQGGIND